jgi:hypothetical protein
MSNKNPPKVAPKAVKPLPKSMWGANCAICDKPHAKWEYLHGDKRKILCSRCLLYRSKLSNTFEGGLKEMIKAVERERGIAFKKKDGELTNADDADRIAGAIVFANRVHAIRDVITLASVMARGRK